MVKLKRIYIQLISAILTNSYFEGFLKGKLYTGKLKNICFPGLNCYACPGAVTTCPIGAFQVLITQVGTRISLYVTGFLILIGTLFGRAICGFICPFGFLQDLLYKIPFKKTNIPFYRYLKYTKYLILLVFVILLPFIYLYETGYATPYFCKLICPAGTLEGGIPFVLLDKGIRESIGVLFYWKLSILGTIIIASLAIKRPFCRLLCPLGAIYSFFNKISIYTYSINTSTCIKCNACYKKCPVEHKIYEKPNGIDCLKCSDCVKVCPTTSINTKFGLK